MAGFSDIKRQARRDVHAAFAIPATYSDTTVSPPVAIGVRFHDRFVSAIGDMGSDYARVLENIDKIVFDSDELTDKGITPKRGGIVTLTDYEGFVLTLDAREPKDGPVKVIWTVTRP